MNSWLQHLDLQLRRQLPELPPANNDPKSLVELESVLGQPLPEPIREFLLWMPVGVHLCLEWEIPYAVGGFFLEPGEMAHIVQDWQKPAPEGTLNWWSPHWLPLIGTEEEVLCLDLLGLFGNGAGSLIYYHIHLAKRPTVFPSFPAWLRWLSQALEKNLGRAFLEDGKLDIVMTRKAIPLYREHFPNFPLRGSALILPMKALPPLFSQLREHGLKVACPLPSGLTAEELTRLLTQSFVREEGRDSQGVRLLLQRQDGSSIYCNLRSGDKAPVLESAVVLAEPIAHHLRGARALTETGQVEAAAGRLCQAAFLCHQAGQDGEAFLMLRRALQLHPENSLASRSLSALQDKEIHPDTHLLRPLLQHLH